MSKDVIKDSVRQMAEANKWGPPPQFVFTHLYSEDYLRDSVRRVGTYGFLSGVLAGLSLGFVLGRFL